MKGKSFYLVVVFVLLVVFTLLEGAVLVFLSKKGKEEPSRSYSTLLSPTPVVTSQPISPIERFENPTFAAGPFQGWREIQGSKDRLLFLGKSFFSPDPKYASHPKIRIGFESSQLFSGKTGTIFAVIKDGEEEVLGHIGDFTSEEIERLIKPGDYIKVIFRRTGNKTGNLQDENDNFLADRMLIRREEGKTRVEKELGRKI